MAEGVFRISIQPAGPDAQDLLDVLRVHCHVQQVGEGEYHAQMHGHMQSGTAISAMSHVLDRERPGWAQEMSMRPTDDP